MFNFFKRKPTTAPVRTVTLRGGRRVQIVGEANYQQALMKP